MKKYFGGLVGAIGGILLGAVNSMAVLDAGQLAVTGALDTMITDLSTWGWTAILAVLTFTVGAKLFKKFVNRAV